MGRTVCQLLFLSLSLTILSSAVSGQAALTAKANSFQPGAAAGGENDRGRDGLLGPVRRVRTEVVKVTSVDGKLVDNGKRILLEMAEYDLKGSKTQNQYFPMTDSSPTGRETYKYDDKGNISEMTLLAADGSLISKETYRYDYDSLGNWIKMTTSVAIVENGRIGFEPTEVTYRTIYYYLDARTLEPSASTSAKNESVPPATVNSNLRPFAPDTRSNAAVSPPVYRPINLPAQAAMPETHSFTLPTNSKVELADTPPPKPKPAPLPVSSGVLNGKAIFLPAPTYPEAARTMRATGTVVVEVVIDENGKVVSAQVISGPGILRDASIQAAYRAKFVPTKLSGQPVKVTGTIKYNFSGPR